jgi:hypothetical protein
LDEAESAEVFNEQEILERMRTAVSRNPPPRLAAQQRRLSAFSDLPAGQQDAALVSPEQLAAAGLGVDEEAGPDGAYAEQLRASMLRQISQEMEEVLEAIDRQQQQESDRQEQQDAAAAVATMRAIMREGRDMGGGFRVAAAAAPEQEAGSEEEEFPEYPDYDGEQDLLSIFVPTCSAVDATWPKLAGRDGNNMFVVYCSPLVVSVASAIVVQS